MVRLVIFHVFTVVNKSLKKTKTNTHYFLTSPVCLWHLAQSKFSYLQHGLIYNIIYGVPSVWTDTAPLRLRAPCSRHPTASRASSIWPVAPVLLVIILILMAMLWAAVLLCVRVIVVPLVWVHAGVRLVPWWFRLVVAAAALTVWLILAVVSKQLLLGRRKGEWV